MTPTPKPPSAAGRLRPNLRFGLADGVGYSLMVGFGETYLAAFALALGFGEVFVGLLATLPLLAGSVLQLCSPYGVARLRSRRRWVMLCAGVQIFSFFPLIVVAWRGHTAHWVLLMVATLYWGANFATGPSWTSWMESVVPARIRSRYFSRRNGYTQLAVILAVLASGLALQAGESQARVMTAFGLIFGLAAASRVFSLTMLSRQTEPVKPGGPLPELPLRDVWRRVWRRTEGDFLLYLLLIQLAVSISGPFFAPYMLRHLAFSYAGYMALLSAAFMAKVVILLLGGKLTHALGARRLMLVGGVGIVPVSGLWLISSSFPYLFALQVYSGMMWALYELGVFLMVFERIRVEERTAILTGYNLAHAVCSVLGSLLGAGFFEWVGVPRAYPVVFLVSSIARGLAIPLLLRLGPVPKLPWPVVVRTIGVRPSMGSIGRPLLIRRFAGRRAKR